MLKSALALKEAIDIVPKSLRSMGRCYDIEKEWKEGEGQRSEDSSGESSNAEEAEESPDVEDSPEGLEESERSSPTKTKPFTPAPDWELGTKVRIESPLGDDSKSHVPHIRQFLGQIGEIIRKDRDMYEVQFPTLSGESIWFSRNWCHPPPPEENSRCWLQYDWCSLFLPEEESDSRTEVYWEPGHRVRLQDQRPETDDGENRISWFPSKDRFLGQIGEIVYIDKNGDVIVRFASGDWCGFSEEESQANDPSTSEVQPASTKVDDDSEGEEATTEGSSRRKGTAGTLSRRALYNLLQGLSDAFQDSSVVTGVIETEELAPIQLQVNLPKLTFSRSLADISMGDLESCYEAAPVASYGDLQTMTTETAPEVRQARDLSAQEGQFQVGEALSLQVAKLWCQAFHWHGEVEAVPYKINLYRKGGHFREHRDTPSRSLVGTFLLGLGDTSDGTLRIKAQPREEAVVWPSTARGRWCAFYPDLVHQITPLTSGLRATMAFKILAKTDQHPLLQGQAHALWHRLSVQERQALRAQPRQHPFGLLLTHDYSLEATSLKGLDRAYYDLFRGLGYQITILPVLVTLEAWGRPSKCPGGGSAVYPLTEEALRFVTSDDNDFLEKPVLFSGLTFYGNPKGYYWYLKETPYYEYIGNECQPAEINSLYLHRVMIFG